MTPEWLTAYASSASLLVIALTAYAALRQMRHLRSGNQVAALLPLIEKYEDPGVADSLQYVISGQLAADLRDPATRAGIVTIPMDGPAARGRSALNFYEMIGALVVGGVVDFELVARYFRLPSDVWMRAEDFLALARRSRGDEVYENLEAMVALEARWQRRRGTTSLFPGHLPRQRLVDRYAEADEPV